MLKRSPPEKMSTYFKDFFTFSLSVNFRHLYQFSTFFDNCWYFSTIFDRLRHFHAFVYSLKLFPQLSNISYLGNNLIPYLGNVSYSGDLNEEQNFLNRKCYLFGRTNKISQTGNYLFGKLVLIKGYFSFWQSLQDSHALLWGLLYRNGSHFVSLDIDVKARTKQKVPMKIWSNFTNSLRFKPSWT